MKYIVGNYYWIKARSHDWEICKCDSNPFYPDDVEFIRMGWEGVVYTTDEILEAILIPFPDENNKQV